MCGRIGYSAPEFTESRFQARLLPDEPPQIMQARWNIKPTDLVQVVTRSQRVGGSRGIKAARWDLVPKWAVGEKPKRNRFNLKSTTVLENAGYQGLLKTHRCLIPADGFFEWPAGVAHHIGRPDASVFAFAGIWTAIELDMGWLTSCTMITVDPSDWMSRIHDRQAVILAPEDEASWLDPEMPLDDVVRLLRPCPADFLTAYPVANFRRDDEGAELRTLRAPAPQQVSLPL